MVSVVVVMSKDEARSAMDTVKEQLDRGLNALEQAALIVKELEAREGFRALGHRSMAACLAAELQVTRQRAYQVLDEIKGMALLAEAGVTEVVATRREARQIARHPEVAESVRNSVAGGSEPSDAVKRALAEQREMEAMRRGPDAKPKAKRGGYVPPSAKFIAACNTIIGINDEMPPDGALPYDLQRYAERAYGALETMIAASNRPRQAEEWASA